jgi:hypothetical protein
MAKRDDFLIDWLDAKLKDWGHDRRRLRQSRYPQSVASRLDEPIGYGGSPEPIEGLTGNALLVSVAIRRALESRRLSYKQHAALYLHYDERHKRKPAKVKCQELNVCRDRYYEIIAQAHRRLDAHWPSDIEAKIAAPYTVGSLQQGG